MMMERERFPHPALMAHEEFIRYVNIGCIIYIYFVSLFKLFVKRFLNIRFFFSTFNNNFSVFTTLIYHKNIFIIHFTF